LNFFLASNKYASLSTSSDVATANPNLVIMRQNDAFVGIGTTEPKMTLDVNGDILSKTLSSGELNIKNADMTKNVFSVTKDGKVGVAKENPTKTLQVSGDITSDSLVLKSMADFANMSCSEEGKMIYYKTTQKVMVCDGTSWVNL
jgi:hypothetical protein